MTQNAIFWVLLVYLLNDLSAFVFQEALAIVEATTCWTFQVAHGWSR